MPHIFLLDTVGAEHDAQQSEVLISQCPAGAHRESPRVSIRGDGHHRIVGNDPEGGYQDDAPMVDLQGPDLFMALRFHGLKPKAVVGLPFRISAFIDFTHVTGILRFCRIRRAYRVDMERVPAVQRYSIWVKLRAEAWERKEETSDYLGKGRRTSKLFFGSREWSPRQAGPPRYVTDPYSCPHLL